MSLRSAARFTRAIPRTSLRPSQALAGPAPVARRAASSSAKQAGSDMPWIAGSAVVFGSLGAYIVTSGNKPKDAHAAHVAIGGKHHASPEEKGEHEGPKSAAEPKKEESEPEPEAEPKEDKEEKKEEKKDEKKEEGGDKPEEGEGQSEKDAVVRGLKTDAPPVAAAEGDHKPSPDIPKAGEEKEEKVEDIPEDEAKKSTIRAEKTDAPKVAAAEEAAGNHTQA